MKSIALMTAVLGIVIWGCGTAYKAQPLPFKIPTAYDNLVVIDGAQVAGQAFSEPDAAQAAFGFDIRGAGMLPVQLVFDNQGAHPLEIIPEQTFLEDHEGNLWPILTDAFAYERATRYATTKQTFQEGAYKGFLGAAAGSLIGAAIGIVSGDNVASAAGKGAAVGAAAGATLGGAAAYYGANDARSAIVRDLRDKSLQNKSIQPGDLAHGIIFFPGEADSAKQLRLQLKELSSGRLHTVYLKF
jgi:hypothetical protein